MERFSQYRDRGMYYSQHHFPGHPEPTMLAMLRVVLTFDLSTGSGIAPFFPVTTSTSALALPLHIFLFVVRIPLILTVALSYFLIFAWLPIGSLGKKAALWTILGIPGIWWVDLQIDGVKRG